VDFLLLSTIASQLGVEVRQVVQRQDIPIERAYRLTHPPSNATGEQLEAHRICNAIAALAERRNVFVWDQLTCTLWDNAVDTTSRVHGRNLRHLLTQNLFGHDYDDVDSDDNGSDDTCDLDVLDDGGDGYDEW
jgi:hypothetical protein